jgi:hypothetical protein
MPAKKRAAVEDAEDSSSSRSPVASNKRARTALNGKEHEQTKGRRKGKARANDDENMDDNDDDDGDVNIPSETMEERAEKDKRFEEAHFDKIMASVKSREKYHGVSAIVSLSDAKITDCINVTDCCGVWHH